METSGDSASSDPIGAIGATAEAAAAAAAAAAAGDTAPDGVAGAALLL